MTISAFHHHPRIRLTEQKIAKLFLERHGCCRECGKVLGVKDDWIVEHIIALENGGTNDWDNLGITGMCCKAVKDAADHGEAAKSRRAATRHVLSKSMRPKSALSKKPGMKFNWRNRRYEKLPDQQ